MATPAEIIAARYAGDRDEAPAARGAAAEPAAPSRNGASTPLLADELAFPTLGGALTVLLTPTWVRSGGASAATAASAAAAASVASASSAASGDSNGSAGTDATDASPVYDTPRLAKLSGAAKLSATGGGAGGFRPSTIQDAFLLDVEDQLNVARPEFIKILTTIKTETHTNIECTTSQHTKKRTFLITGKPQDVRTAKRLVIKKLTRPVTVVFEIAARARLRVIGPRGLVLKPIVQNNEVRIDIGHEAAAGAAAEAAATAAAEDDLDEPQVRVTIEGDVEGCKRAKLQIMAIAREVTKHVTTRVGADEAVRPFVARVLEPLVAAAKRGGADVDAAVTALGVVILGDRDAVVELRGQVGAALAQLALQLSTVEVAIPRVKQQFLPRDAVLEQFGVLIRLPQHASDPVQFVGAPDAIALAQEEARRTTSQYKVEVLEMAKAHRGNLGHVRAVARLLQQNGVFDKIGEAHGVVVNVPRLSESALIPIEIVSQDAALEGTKQAKRAIVGVVNRIAPLVARVVSDIDEFFADRVPAALREAADAHDVDFVVFGLEVTLFPRSVVQQEEEEDFGGDASEALAAVDAALSPLRELAAQLETRVLAIAAERQEAVAGTTLQLILGGAPETVVKLHTPSADEVLVRGVGFVDAVCRQIEQALQPHNFAVTATVEFPTAVLSRLIGKNGANLNALQQEFGVRIDVGKREEGEASPQTSVEVAGPALNVAAAQARIHEVAKKWSDETLVRLHIEERFHGKIIGAAGVYINRLQDKYGVRIRFPSSQQLRSQDAPKTKDEVTIRGPSRGVAKAEEELKELYLFERENGFKETLRVPTRAMAYVIGREGEHIKGISDSTGVEYSFNRKHDEKALGYAELELTGSRVGLKQAAAKIEQIVAEVENLVSVTIEVDPKYHSSLIGPGGAVMRQILSAAGGDELARPKYHKLMVVPSAGSGLSEVVSSGPREVVDKVVEQVKAFVARRASAVTQAYELPKQKHGAIIGPGGLVRQALQDKHGCTISVPKAESKLTTIELEGLPEDVAALRAELDELTKDDWNEEIEVPLRLHALVSERGTAFAHLRNEFGVEVHHGDARNKAGKLSKARIPVAPPRPEGAEGAAHVVMEGVAGADAAGVIPWRFKGDAANTARAAEYVAARLKAAEAATSTGWYYLAPGAAVSKIIGARGAKLNRIRNATGTFIALPPKDAADAERAVYLVGTEQSVAAAVKEIEAALK